MIGGAVAAQGITLGKYYFEADLSGPCAIVGVVSDRATPRKFPGFDVEGFGYGNLEGQGGWLLQDYFIDFGPSGPIFEVGTPTRVGIAIDASNGKFWISRNGKWMYDLYFDETDSGPTDDNVGGYFEPGYTNLYAAAGRYTNNLQCPDTVSVQAYFQFKEFMYPMPEDFTAYLATDCSCTKTYAQCLTMSINSSKIH